MPDFVWRMLLSRRVHGNAAWVAGLLRVVIGGVFTFGFAMSKFTDHAKEVRDFRSWDVPVASVSVYVAGLVELICGLMLIFGVLTRVAALILAGEMVVAILTAGRAEGFGFHTTVPPLMIVGLLFIVYAGGGPVSLDHVVSRRLREEDPDEPDGDPEGPKIGRDWT
jgi:putative oxidoreductase